MKLVLSFSEKDTSKAISQHNREFHFRHVNLKASKRKIKPKGYQEWTLQRHWQHCAHKTANIIEHVHIYDLIKIS